MEGILNSTDTFEYLVQSLSLTERETEAQKEGRPGSLSHDKWTLEKRRRPDGLTKIPTQSEPVATQVCEHLQLPGPHDTLAPSAPADQVVHTGLHARAHVYTPDPFPSSLQDPACLWQRVGSRRDL